MVTNNENMDATAVDTKTDAEPKAPVTSKKRSSRRQKPASEPARTSAKDRSASPVAKQRKYSEKERNDKLREIEAKVADGAGTLKDAIKAAGISEQTYYQWKRTAKPAESPTQKNDDVPVAATVVDDEVAEFSRLEEENQRLRKLLAEKLRAENAELRKRLGMS